MKSNVIALLVICVVLAASETQAVIYVPSPPGNIVQNGTFQSGYADWSGTFVAIVDDPNAPNGGFPLLSDIYQDLPTNLGQEYSLDFYAAADLYFAPSVAVAIDVNNQTLVKFITPPYTYNPGVNRYDQMHWQEYTLLFVASTSPTRLEFVDETTYDFGLQAVSVVPVPEPATTAMMVMAGALMICWSHRWKQAQPNCPGANTDRP